MAKALVFQNGTGSIFGAELPPGLAAVVSKRISLLSFLQFRKRTFIWLFRASSAHIALVIAPGLRHQPTPKCSVHSRGLADWHARVKW